MVVHLPQITLDTTLADLYNLNGENADDISTVFAIPAPASPVSTSLPDNTTLVHQNPNYNMLDRDIYARILLATFSQYFGFVVGSILVNLSDPD